MTDTANWGSGSVDENALTNLLLDPAIYAGDPFPLYARLRAEAPVARNDTVGLWMVSHRKVAPVSSPLLGS